MTDPILESNFDNKKVSYELPRYGLVYEISCDRPELVTGLISGSGLKLANSLDEINNLFKSCPFGFPSNFLESVFIESPVKDLTFGYKYRQNTVHENSEWKKFLKSIEGKEYESYQIIEMSPELTTSTDLKLGKYLMFTTKDGRIFIES